MSRRARAARGVTLTRLSSMDTGELIRQRSVAAVRGASAALTALSGPLRPGARCARTGPRLSRVWPMRCGSASLPRWLILTRTGGLIMSEVRVRCTDGTCRIVSGHGHVTRRRDDSWIPAAVSPERAGWLVASDYHLARRRDDWARAKGAERERLARLVADGVAELDAAQRSGAVVPPRRVEVPVEVPCQRTHVEFGDDLTGALVEAAALMVAAGEPGRGANVLRTAAGRLDDVAARDAAREFRRIKAEVDALRRPVVGRVTKARGR